MKPVTRKLLKNNFIKWYKSIEEASKDSGISRKLISDACHGSIEFAGDSTWDFTYEEDSLRDYKELGNLIEEEVTLRMLNLK